MTTKDFQPFLWTEFIAQRPEPDDPTLCYGGPGRSEDKLRHFTGTPFYQALLPETQNALRHIRRVEWLRRIDDVLPKGFDLLMVIVLFFA